MGSWGTKPRRVGVAHWHVFVQVDVASACVGQTGDGGWVRVRYRGGARKGVVVDV